MTASEIAGLLLDRKAVSLRPDQPFTFSSGILSPIYCDNRLLLSDPPSRSKVSEALTQAIQEFQPKQIGGVATAGIAWGALSAEKLSLPFLYVRGEAKSHGKGKRIEGEIAKVATVIVEDLVSTGDSVISAAIAVRDEGAKISGVVSIFAYGFKKSSEAFQKAQLAFRPLATLDQLLDVAIKRGEISSKQRNQIEAWRESPDTWKPA